MTMKKVKPDKDEYDNNFSDIQDSKVSFFFAYLKLQKVFSLGLDMDGRMNIVFWDHGTSHGLSGGKLKSLL